MPRKNSNIEELNNGEVKKGNKFLKFIKFALSVDDVDPETDPELQDGLRMLHKAEEELDAKDMREKYRVTSTSNQSSSSKSSKNKGTRHRKDDATLDEEREASTRELA